MNEKQDQNIITGVIQGCKTGEENSFQHVFIQHEQILRRASYKSGNSLIRSIVEKYEQGAPIGLDLLEIVQRIESETSAKPAKKSTNHAGGAKGDCGEADDSEVIPDEDFVRVRSTASHAGSVGLTHASLILVRDILNRYYQQQTEKNTTESRNVLDDSHLYDEEAAETAQTGDDPVLAQKLSETNQKQDQEAIELKRFQIIKAIGNYSQEQKARSRDVPFQAVDLLKLRLLLEIILSSSLLTEGYSIIRLIPEGKSDRDTSCHLVGKVLFAFFAGSHSPVEHVILPEGLDEYPIDYMETWACCRWTVQELCRQSATNSELSTLLPSLLKLSNQIDIKTVRRLAPTQRDKVDELMKVMANRYKCHI